MFVFVAPPNVENNCRWPERASKKKRNQLSGPYNPYPQQDRGRIRQLAKRIVKSLARYNRFSEYFDLLGNKAATYLTLLMRDS